MNQNAHIIVTSINEPNEVMRALAKGAIEHGATFSVIGDVVSPKEFALDGCQYYSLQRQAETGFRFAEVCPVRHYTRKNIGYLTAMRDAAEIIVETDDDNLPREGFWKKRERVQEAAVLSGAGWVNVLAWFSDERIWARGYPLDAVDAPMGAYDELKQARVDCPIQMGLADGNPDVDAVYRLLMKLPVTFRRGRKAALGEGSWAPFNSQNTTWWPEAYPLMYLPSCCTFRATDIWRGLVAQRVAWAHGWCVLHDEASVWQDRNEHSLMRDFEQEVPVYVHTRAIAQRLERLALSSAVGDCGRNLAACYEELVRGGYVGADELRLVEAWLADIDEVRRARA